MQPKPRWQHDTRPAASDGVNRLSTLGPGGTGARVEAARPGDRVVRVLERHPDAVEALPGFVWLDMPRKSQSSARLPWVFRG